MPRTKLHNEPMYRKFEVNTNHGPLRENDLAGIHKVLKYCFHKHSRIAVAHLTLNTDISYNSRNMLTDDETRRK